MRRFLETPLSCTRPCVFVRSCQGGDVSVLLLVPVWCLVPLLFTHLQCRVFLPFCRHLHFKMYIFLALNVHSVGPVSITVVFLLHIPYLASPDV